MRRGGGAAKGSKSEREVARMLSKWYYGESGHLWRRPGNERRRYDISGHTGDIVPLNTKKTSESPWPFHVENKFVKKNSSQLHLLLAGKRNKIMEWYNKAQQQKRKDLMVMLLVKENNRPRFCFTSAQLLGQWGVDWDCPSITFMCGKVWVRGVDFELLKSHLRGIQGVRYDRKKRK